MTLETVKYDPADYLDSAEAVAAYVDAAFEDGDPAVIATALGSVARVRGMTDVARAAGLSRESLYRTLSPDGNPELGTIIRVMRALGLRLAVAPDTMPA